MTRIVLCKDCGAEKSPKGLYCKKCGYRHRTRPSGLKYNLKVKNKAWFKKGNIPWDKGIKLPYEVWIKGKKGVLGANRTSFKSEDVKNEKNCKWKGDLVGYYALHLWVKRNIDLGKCCKFCGSVENLEIANTSYKYNRDAENWTLLCAKCHKRYDYKNNWGYATKTFNLKRLKNG